jgi:long-chain acyl-CoA synthetase
VGRPNSDWGEEVVAFVVCKSGVRVSIEELENLCINNIGRFKRPREYFFTKKLPKNNYGKVLKTKLRDIL